MERTSSGVIVQGVLLTGNFGCPSAQRFERKDVVMSEPQSICEGRRSRDDDEGAVTVWSLFRRSEVEVWLGEPVDEYIDTTLTRDGYHDPDQLATELTGWARTHGMPGRWFWQDPSIRISRSYVLITQWGAYDV